MRRIDGLLPPPLLASLALALAASGCGPSFEDLCEQANEQCTRQTRLDCEAAEEASVAVTEAAACEDRYDALVACGADTDGCYVDRCSSEVTAWNDCVEAHCESRPNADECVRFRAAFQGR